MKTFFHNRAQDFFKNVFLIFVFLVGTSTSPLAVANTFLLANLGEIDQSYAVAIHSPKPTEQGQMLEEQEDQLANTDDDCDTDE